jgi:hypothetical protein
MKTIALLAVLALAAVASAAESEPGPRPGPGPGPSPRPNGASWERAGPPAISAAPLQAVTAPVSPAPRKPGAADAGELQGAKAVALKEGEGTLLVGGSAVSVRPGSVIGSDVVTSIGSDRIILVRGATAANPSGEATVVVSFDARGQARVRVYWLSDPAAKVPREVR